MSKIQNSTVKPISLKTIWGRLGIRKETIWYYRKNKSLYLEGLGSNLGYSALLENSLKEITESSSA